MTRRAWIENLVCAAAIAGLGVLYLSTPNDIHLDCVLNTDPSLPIPINITFDWLHRKKPALNMGDASDPMPGTVEVNDTTIYAVYDDQKATHHILFSRTTGLWSAWRTGETGAVVGHCVDAANRKF
jgi:hypothetical protein